MLLVEPLHFTPEHLTRPAVTGIDVITTLKHFAIITYPVDPESLRRHLAPRFEPVCIRLNDGSIRAMVSVAKSSWARNHRHCNRWKAEGVVAASMARRIAPTCAAGISVRGRIICTLIYFSSVLIAS